MKRLNDDNFDLMTAGRDCIVAFCRPGCRPCEEIKPSLKEFERKTGVPVFEVSTMESIKIADRFKIIKAPTVYLLKNGEEEDLHIGYMSVAELEEWTRKNGLMHG